MKVQNADFILASLLTSYPDDGFREDVKAMIEDGDAGLPESLKAKIRAFTADERRLDDLRSEYLELFDSGRGVAPLYETEYGRQRAFFKANELSEISGFYRAFGFELGGEEMAREMPDHLSVELEFYSLLRLKQDHLEGLEDKDGAEIVLDARKKFLGRHLGKFVSAILARPGVEGSPTYGEILGHCNALIQAECNLLGVKPDSTSWIEGEQEAGEMACGGTVGCLK